MTSPDNAQDREMSDGKDRQEPLGDGSKADYVADAEPCPLGRTDYEECFAPFRYCPVKGCGRTEAPKVEAHPMYALDDRVRNLLDIVRRRVENAQEKRWPLEPPTWPMPHTHYNPVTTCEHGQPLHVGWLEMAQEVELVQQLMDFVGIPDGLAQGRGDADWRVAEAVVRLTEADERLSRIVQNHSQEQGSGGTVGSYCVECGHTWPCPTYRFANGDAATSDSWTGDDS